MECRVLKLFMAETNLVITGHSKSARIISEMVYITRHTILLSKTLESVTGKFRGE